MATTSFNPAPPHLQLVRFDWPKKTAKRYVLLQWANPGFAVDLQRRQLGEEKWETLHDAGGTGPATSPFTDDANLDRSARWFYRLRQSDAATGNTPLVSNIVEVSFGDLADVWQLMLTDPKLRDASPDKLERIADAPAPAPPKAGDVVLAEIEDTAEDLLDEQEKSKAQVKKLRQSVDAGSATVQAGLKDAGAQVVAAAAGVQGELARAQAWTEFGATTPALAAGRSAGKLALSWGQVPAGAQVEIMRSETGPTAGFKVIGTTDGTTVSGGLRRRVDAWYRVRFVQGGHRSLESDPVHVRPRRYGAQLAVPGAQAGAPAPGGGPATYAAPGGVPPSYGPPGGGPPTYAAPGGGPTSYPAPAGGPPSYGPQGGPATGIELREPRLTPDLVHLEWTDPIGQGKGAYVVIRTDEDGKKERYRVQGGSAFKGMVQPGSTYRYQVKTEREGGKTARSNEVRVTVPAREADTHAAQASTHASKADTHGVQAEPPAVQE